MQKKKLIKKLVLNTAIISNVLLSGIIISGTYELNPEIISLSATTVASTSYFVKTKIRENNKKN